MSSYLNVYIRHKGKDPFLLKYFSRNHPVYQAIHDNLHVIWEDKLDCKEWYKYRHDDSHTAYPYKYVATKAEAVHPIPENAEYEDQLNQAINKEISFDDINTKPVYSGYFVKEEYDSLPSESEMIVSQTTRLTPSDLNLALEDVKKDLDSAVSHYKEEHNLAKYEQTLRNILHEAFPNAVSVNSSTEEDDDLGWEDYIDELRLSYYWLMFLANLHEDVELYAYFD